MHTSVAPFTTTYVCIIQFPDAGPSIALGPFRKFDASYHYNTALDLMELR